MSVRKHSEVFSMQSSFGDVFKKASRHSRRISILKIFLPFLALVSALVFCWFTFFLVPATSDSMSLNNEENEVMNLTMLNPKLEGYARAHEPYWLKAEKAFQDPTHSGIIGLKNITAKAFMGQQRQVFLAAQRGVYDNINGFLQLDKPFTVTTNDGIMVQFMSASIDLSEGQLKTDQRVNIQRAGLHLAANALQIREKGKNIYLHGGVHLVLKKK
ncbi:lipopolysaccharide export system protein LptC [Bartonella fuyuanensis]|uniref:Lipopolysaccharide export system protein LptC n=1 Tax=Bartonella fuyuanensis TaxID=1460968 RepID=A0A840E3Z3_9HYPH|nr:LPS export ABC transporter periplasmic protein LptC [Bartonella fuyuanensis]MBB4075896.1 lipopolysaccharide export system protein LptC [Bartonella fuyuanensis]